MALAIVRQTIRTNAVQVSIDFAWTVILKFHSILQFNDHMMFTADQQSHLSFDEQQIGKNIHRDSMVSATNNYGSNDDQQPVYRPYQDLTMNPPYRARENPSTIRTGYPSKLPSRNEHADVYEKVYRETRSETQHRRSSPTSGVQVSHELEHHRSGSPSIVRTLDDDRFRSNVNLDHRNATSSSPSSRQVEVREYSRRLGGSNANNHSELPLFAQGFNSDAFYRSAFKPQILTNDRGEKTIEMKLDVNNYQPAEIKVSVNGNDLIVQAEHNDDRPPVSSARVYFFKQISLPPNTDLDSLSSQYHPNGQLQITAKLVQEQESMRYK
jgi:HSP20 family molecular chaperone IbpA